MTGMCEQLFKYDCGHLYRRILRCSKQREQHLSSKPFSSQSSLNGNHCHGIEKLQRRATLCPQCEMLEKDREAYVNSTKRASLPIAQAKTDFTQYHESDDLFTAGVSTRNFGLRRTKSNPALLPSQHLRRVQGMDNDSLRNEYTRLESRHDSIFQAQGDRNTGIGSRHIKEIRLELSRDSDAEAGLVQHDDSRSLDGKCIPSELARSSSLKAPSHPNTSKLSSNSQQARLKFSQHHDFKLDHNQNSGGDVQHNEKASPKRQIIGNISLSNRHNPTRPSHYSSLRARYGKKVRLRDLVMSILELDWYTPTYITCMLFSPSSGINFPELRNHTQSESDEPRTPAARIVHPEKKVRKRLQKMRSLYHHLDSSNESFVCSRAREVENSER
jgi:hypothetical protein